MQHKQRVREQNQFFNNQGLCVMKREKKKGKKQVKTEGSWGGGKCMLCECADVRP